VLRGSAAELAQELEAHPRKGEVVLVVGAARAPRAKVA
jgi:16S rRNA C1402 (ribose-2'-O) methylase RsmI